MILAAVTTSSCGGGSSSRGGKAAVKRGQFQAPLCRLMSDRMSTEVGTALGAEHGKGVYAHVHAVHSNTRAPTLQVNPPIEHVQRMLSLRQASMCTFSSPLNVERLPSHSLAPAMLRLCPSLKVVRLPPHTQAPPPMPPTPILSFNLAGQKLWLRQFWLLLTSRYPVMTLTSSPPQPTLNVSFHSARQMLWLRLWW